MSASGLSWRRQHLLARLALAVLLVAMLLRFIQLHMLAPVPVAELLQFSQRHMRPARYTGTYCAHPTQ